jgi:hypothetical protein
MRAAQLNDQNVVINYAEVAGFGYPFVDPKDSVIGSTYDPDTGDFTNPPPEPPAPVARHITVLAFRNRFTQAEKVAIELAAADNPAAPMADRQKSAAIRASQADAAAATYIDLDREDTRAGVTALEAGGILGAGRALEILDAPVQPHEIPKA